MILCNRSRHSQYKTGRSRAARLLWLRELRLLYIKASEIAPGAVAQAPRVSNAETPRFVKG